MRAYSSSRGDLAGRHADLSQGPQGATGPALPTHNAVHSMQAVLAEFTKTSTLSRRLEELGRGLTVLDAAITALDEIERLVSQARLVAYQALIAVERGDSGASRVSPYNALLAELSTEATDAGRRGVNLLQGQTLQLVFNEPGKSTFTLEGLCADAEGLELADVTKADFATQSCIDPIIETLDRATVTVGMFGQKLRAAHAGLSLSQTFSDGLIDSLLAASGQMASVDTHDEAARVQRLQVSQMREKPAQTLMREAERGVLQFLKRAGGYYR